MLFQLKKAGDPSNLANYRPISLLQAFYKILALDAGLSDWIIKTQFGFRADRSTAQALFLARRNLDISERTCKHITLILLDWEKGF